MVNIFRQLRNMDIDTMTDTIKEEILTDDETISDSSLMTEISSPKVFSAKIFDGKLDKDLLCDVAEYILEANKVIKTNAKYLQWRAIGFTPKSNNHALRVMAKTFVDFIPQEIVIRYGDHELLYFEHLSNRRFESNLQPANVITNIEADGKEIWQLNLQMTKPRLGRKRRFDRTQLKKKPK